MFREIRKKTVILSRRKPFKKDAENLIHLIEKKNWIFFNMRLEGSNISMENIQAILSEEMVNLPLEDMMLFRNLEDLLDAMKGWAKEKAPLSRRMFGNIYSILSGSEPRIRKSSPTVIELSYVPMLSEDIEGKIDELISFSKEETFDFVKQAVDLHNMFIKIYPFDEFNQMVARAIMVYHLMTKEMPIGYIDIKEEEYNGVLSRELNRGYEESGLYTPVVKGTLEMLNIMDNLTMDYR